MKIQSLFDKLYTIELFAQTDNLFYKCFQGHIKLGKNRDGQLFRKLRKENAQAMVFVHDDLNIIIRNVGNSGESTLYTQGFKRLTDKKLKSLQKFAMTADKFRINFNKERLNPRQEGLFTDRDKYPSRRVSPNVLRKRFLKRFPSHNWILS